MTPEPVEAATAPSEVPRSDVARIPPITAPRMSRCMRVLQASDGLNENTFMPERDAGVTRRLRVCDALKAAEPPGWSWGRGIQRRTGQSLVRAVEPRTISVVGKRTVAARRGGPGPSSASASRANAHAPIPRLDWAIV